MSVSNAQLEAKLVELRKTLEEQRKTVEQLVSNSNALIGAIQISEQYLAESDSLEVEVAGEKE